jgi:hypothetical protein
MDLVEMEVWEDWMAMECIQRGMVQTARTAYLVLQELTEVQAATERRECLGVTTNTLPASASQLLGIWKR